MAKLTAHRKHLAIALVSAAVLLLQIAVTRILSVLLWYHFAFFSISIAMLGLGAPGVWLSLRRPRPGRLAEALLGAAVLVPVGIAMMLRAAHHFGDWAIVYCMLCLLPGVLCLGTAVCLLLLAAPGAAVTRMYGFDLLGACAGALLVVPLMSVAPTPHLAAAVGLLPLGAYAVLRPGRSWRVAAATAVVLLAVLVYGRPFQVQHTKQYEETGPLLTPIYVKWTPTARLAVFADFPWAPGSAFQWGVGTHGEGQDAPRQYWLEQDASAGTAIVELRADGPKLDYLLYDVTSVGYQVRFPSRVAIVGPGGGRDILTARLSGASHIDAIELNQGIVDALRGPFASFSGGVYDLPGVQAIVGEGRSVLTRSGGGYDVIQISMIDSWAATAAGAYALSENNLYTIEAFRLFLDRLSDHGLVSTSRWMPGDRFGFELPRLVRLASAALEAHGAADARAHIAVVQGDLAATVLMSRQPWTPQDLDRLRQVCTTRGFLLHFPEPDTLPEPQRHVSRWLRPEAGQLAKHGLLLTPPTDDKPFFFQTLSPFSSLAPQAARHLGFNAQSVATLQRLMITMAVLTLLLFFTPFLLTRWLRRSAGFWRGSLFFTAIGLAFMLVEIAWLQRFVLYLGHPSRATTAALACVLLGAGLGSMSAARVGLPRVQRWGWVVAAGTAGWNSALGPVFDATLGWGLLARVLCTALLLVPAGFAMGFFFPLGMVRFGDHHKAWFWALNGAASVLASVASLALAMELGLSTVAFIGAAIYGLSWLLLTGGASRPQAA